MADPRAIKVWDQDDGYRYRLVHTGAQYEVQYESGGGWRAEPPEHSFGVLASLVAEEEGFDA